MSTHLATICIFCRAAVIDDHVEHILPESLGGGPWACARPGVICKKCNQYFGSKVERRALDSFPFNILRLFLGIPSKKGRPIRVPIVEGQLIGSLLPGAVGFEPTFPADSTGLAQALVLAEVSEPIAVCQLLLKMGLEVVASANPSDALLDRFNAARKFARAARKGSDWWFLIESDAGKALSLARLNRQDLAISNSFSMETYDLGGVEVFVLRLAGFTLLTPLESGTFPPPSDDGSSNSAIVWARIPR